MTHTPTLPIDDRSMWRRLIGRAHPDAGGSHELFIWAATVREFFCDREPGSEILRREHGEQPSRRRETSTPSECVPFDEDAFLEVLTDRAVAMAEAVAEPYGH